MKLVLITIFILSSLQLHCQILASKEYVLTPLGITEKTNIHYVAHNQHINISKNEIQIVKNQSNLILKNVNKSKDGTVINDNFKNGWTTWADGHIYDDFPSSPTYFKVNYIVPPDPKDNHQLIYIFNGLGAIDSGISHIVQPVLQWGRSPAGGGSYWGLCNWYVNNNQFFYDSLIRVNPGDTLQGLVEMTAIHNRKADYFSSFLGYKSGLRITNLPKLESLYVVLETFNANCNDLPKNEKIKIQEIRVRSDIENPTLLWNKYDNNTCGQYTTIVNQSSTNGEIHLNFHSPFSFEDYDEVHIFPNPIRDYLHISPNGIKNVLGYRQVINDCTIQIFDSAGKVIYSDFYPELTDEFDLDFSNFRTGIFFIRFLYNNKDHTFKIIKI